MEKKAGPHSLSATDFLVGKRTSESKLVYYQLLSLPGFSASKNIIYQLERKSNEQKIESP